MAWAVDTGPANQPSDLTAHRLIRRLDLPIEWSAQKQLLGFA